MPKCDVNGEVGWFCVVLCFMGSRVIILSMLLDIAQPMGLLPPRPIRVPRCFFLVAVEACVASLPRGDNLPIGVLTFDLLEKVEDLESFDLVDRQEPAEESGLEAVEVERGDWTLGKMRREEVFRPPKPSVNVDVCENNACMAMVLITVFSQLIYGIYLLKYVGCVVLWRFGSGMRWWEEEKEENEPVGRNCSGGLFLMRR